jgi:hypothetical protein
MDKENFEPQIQVTLIIYTVRGRIYHPYDRLYHNCAFLVTHYAEGSLMPLLVQKIIFDMVPKRLPFLIRPIAKVIFGQLEKQIIQPEYKKHHDLVRPLHNTAIFGTYDFKNID